MATNGTTSKTPRAGLTFKLDWRTVSQDASLNQSVIEAKVYLITGPYTYTDTSGGARTGTVIIDGQSENINYSVQIGVNTTRLLGTVTKTVTHNNEGIGAFSITATLPFNLTMAGQWTGVIDLSLTANVNDIARASKPTLNYNEREVRQTVRIYTNRASENFNHGVFWTWGSGHPWNLIDGSVGVYTDWVIPDEIVDGIQGGKSRSLSIVVETKNNTVYIGENRTTLKITIPNISAFQPTASLGSVADTVAMGGISNYVQNYSKLNIKSNTAGLRGSHITETRVTIDGSIYYGRDITTNTIKSSGALPIKIRATDNRGFSREVSASVMVDAYSAPTLTSFKAKRWSTDMSTNLKVDFTFKIASISGQNGKGYIIRYRQGGAWQILEQDTTSFSGTVSKTYNGILNADLPYEVQVNVYDYFGGTRKELFIPSVFKLIDYNTSGRGIAFGQKSDMDAMQINMNVHLNGQLYKDGEVAYQTQPILDNRTTNQPPSWYTENYPQQRVIELKVASTISISGMGARLVTLETTVPWNTIALGVYQIATVSYYATLQQYIRDGRDGTWTAWKGF